MSSRTCSRALIRVLLGSVLLYNPRPPLPQLVHHAASETHTRPFLPEPMARSRTFPLPHLLLLLALSCRWWCGAVVTAARPVRDASGGSTATASAFVKSWCAGTEYPAVCDATLAPYAGKVGASPARLAWAALDVTLGGARDAAAAMKAMAAAGHVAAEAARDCVAMLEDAVGLLRQSVDAMASLGREEEPGSGSDDVRFQVDSVQTWASAAMTNDDMCMEGFKAEPADAREAVRGHVVGVLHLTANALGIVNAMAKQIP